MNQEERNGLQQIIDKVLDDMMQDCADEISLDDVNLAEFARRTGLTRSKARTIKEHGFKVLPHGRTGMRAKVTVLTDYTTLIDTLLKKGVTNSSVIADRIREVGYSGGITAVKDYVSSHIDLVPAPRKVVRPAERGTAQRFSTAPGQAYQMDWGFTDVRDWTGAVYRIACFAMVCHHCGYSYIEFFPNARQENLFIGMIHAFMLMGIPKEVLTDNMKSVVIRRDADSRPVWQLDYAAFMSLIGFSTRLCKPRHPFTKGKVERLVRFVKGNFLAGREFRNITQLNAEALAWCDTQARRYHRALDLVPAEQHSDLCLPACSGLDLTRSVELYLCPARRVSFDGFVSYEGRRFGIPYWYPGKVVRVRRDDSLLHVYADDLSRELVSHTVTWSRKDSFCEDQYADIQPCELPTGPVRTMVEQLEPRVTNPTFAKFDFEGML